ncbi:MAG: hypothetical protein JST26_01795 [Bacteroidetes bacterium]|nr:hypothetical protein [Bacteroidota bacterium]
MNVNDIYSDITSFWDNIYPIILFHIIFYLLYRFAFGNLSIKSQLEKYIASDSFERTKKILQQFELWTKLPFILLISTLIYLALFNSATNFISSIRVFPFDFVYSNDEFMREYIVKEDLTDIARYSTDTTGAYDVIDQLRTKYIEEYKTKHPEKYESWVGWTDKSFSNKLRYFHLFECLLILFIITFLIQIRIKNGKRLRTTFRVFFVLILSIPTLFVLRYQAEQKVEERFIAELIFVRNELKTDNTANQIWTTEQIESVKRKWDEERKHLKDYNHLLWVSRIVERYEILETILGPRRIQTMRYGRK